MGIYLGLDIGTNSVGSAWVDTDNHEVTLGLTVFPAGVDDKREPRAKKRREKRSLRRTLARKAARKRLLRSTLFEAGLLPSPESDDAANLALMQLNPWELRSAALDRPLAPHEFGRVLVHLNQRRGWQAGIEDQEEDDKDKKKKLGLMKTARGCTVAEITKRDAKTFGRLMALLEQERTHDKHRDPIRNRKDSYEWHADRELVHGEFDEIWKRQSSFDSPLARLLTPKVREIIEDVIFFQRDTYWKVSTLGRCDLEPTDRQCPKTDMHAQRFLMLETVNRIRINGAPLTDQQRHSVIDLLSTSPKVNMTQLRKALGLKRGQGEINIEREKKPEINTDWFSAAIVHGVFGRERWEKLPDRTKESVNRAIQREKFDDERLRRGAREWWALDEEQTERLIAAWRNRPKGRTKFSRKAILNLLPHLQRGDDVTTAKEHYGYCPHGYRLNKATRQYIQKHPDQLPPAPDLPNPIVRKAIHEVRRHVQAYLQKFGRKPDRIVVELARDARQPKKLRDALLDANRERERERKQIVEDVLKPNGVEESQWPKAVDRVRLHRRQRGVCPYSDLGTGKAPCISETQAVLGTDVEIDHIVPDSRSFDNSLNNKLLCLRHANRNKADRTPKEWLTEEQFRELEQRLEYFKKEHLRAWENLHRDAPKIEGFVNSQLTDTGYISREVVAYLREALYRDRPHDVLCTKGVYTAILRRDWSLMEEKRRDDHRNHAIDAAAIALSDRKRLQDLAHRAQAQERARVGLDHWPKREKLEPPWEGFRDQVMKLANDMIVAHRAQFGLSSAFHEDTIYGNVPGYEGIFTCRVRASNLTPKMLRDPEVIGTRQGKTLKVGKGGVVRDPALREHIRTCLQNNGIDPDNFTKNQMKEFVKAGKLTMASGVPIRRVRLLKKIEDPVAIDRDPRHPRFYIGGNNHHLEIVQDERTGKWRGRGVKMFEVARRIHPPKGQPERPAILGPKIEQLRAKGLLTGEDERFYKDGKFVMSLCKGEMLRMNDPDTGKEGYFVVAKINPDSVEMVEHSDARPASETENQPARRLIPPKSAARLQALNAVKVRVSPFGEVCELGR